MPFQDAVSMAKSFREELCVTEIWLRWMAAMPSSNGSNAYHRGDPCALCRATFHLRIYSSYGGFSLESAFAMLFIVCPK